MMISKKFMKEHEMLRCEKGLYSYYLASTSAVLLWSASFVATKLAYETLTLFS